MHPRLERIITGSLFAGLEVQFLAEGIVMHLAVLRKKGQQLVVEKLVSGIENSESLSQHLAKNIPLAIAFTGKGILHRRMNGDPSGNPQLFLSKLLPNASLKEFYMQLFPAACDEQFVSVLRKPSVDAVLEQLKMFSITGCSLGPFAAINSLPLLSDVSNELRFGNHTFHLQDSLAEEMFYSPENSEVKIFDIGGQKVEAEMLLAFSVAFQQLLSISTRAETPIESLQQLKEDFLQRKLFVTGGKALLVSVILLLLGNYFLFSGYWSEKNELDSKLQINGGALTDLRNLEKQLETKRAFLEQAGLLSGSAPSYYADQLAAGLPGDILFTRMNLAPRLKLTEEDSIGFKPGRIEISGSCPQSVVLNKWLQELKTKSWVKNAILESYLQDKNMKQGEFEIILELE
jgi:hypothetical protein